MTEQLVALVPGYGVYVLALVVGLSCFGLPVPSSLMMMLGGSLAAVGDLDLASVVAAALGAAIIADQLGFLIGRHGGKRVLARLSRDAGRRGMLDKARQFIDRRGGISVFLSRWLLSPLGPYVNLIGGAMGMNWVRFTAWGVAGEAIWVALYVTLGFAFSSNVMAAADIVGNASGVIVAGAMTLYLGWKLWKGMR